MSRSTQCERILQYVKDHGTISAGEAAWELGILSFHRRLSDLKAKGYLVAGEWTSRKNRDGDDIRFEQYRILAPAPLFGEGFVPLSSCVGLGQGKLL
jgi:hypothetical protein